MIWLIAALVVIAAAAAALVVIGKRPRRKPPMVPPELAARLEAATRAFVDAAPWQPATAPGAPTAAAAIEAALIAREPKRALEVAESALAASPSPDAATRIWLAWALCANAQPSAALDQLAKAEAVDAKAADAHPLAVYLAARAEYLVFEHGHGAIGPVPPLITTGDLAIVTLGSGRGAATWLTGATDIQLSAAQVQGAIAEHRQITARCLAGALDALDRTPGFADAAYLAARLAIKAGLVAPARALFDALAPRILGRPDADAFERDRKDLADPTRAVAAAKDKPIEKGQRSRSLRVLP